MAVFEASVPLNSGIDEVFEFLLRPANVQQISHPDMGLSYVNAPELVAVGVRIDFKVQSMGIVQELSHEITVVEAPHRILEKQIAGPLQLWIHDHLFEATPEGGVRVIDRIEFEPPSGLAGLLVTEDRIRSSLEDGFDHRYLQLETLFGKVE
ncbi:MAG: hypothetical protein CMJ48_10850 [Planctomycetaceae bacterium]|nr:hypothetical protein [Planctomycetaceae bacterium]